jgi:hypothetical protein
MEQVVEGLVIRQLVAAVRERLLVTLAGVKHRQVQVSAAAAAAAATAATAESRGVWYQTPLTSWCITVSIRQYQAAAGAHASGRTGVDSSTEPESSQDNQLQQNHKLMSGMHHDCRGASYGLVQVMPPPI